MNELISKAISLHKKIRENSPLCHNITNYVVMNLTANVTLAIGASPVMAHAIEEVEEMVNLAQVLVINIGTLSKHWIEAMYLAAIAAQKKGIPIVLDPVGAGATKFRTDVAHTFIEKYTPSIIRGNSSEILALIKEGSKTKGVDSIHSLDDVKTDAVKFAAKNNCVVAVTGPEDFITNGSDNYSVKNGHPMLSMVTGTGCSATSVIGAFASVANPDDFAIAAAAALGFYGLAAEFAARDSNAPASFGNAVIDWLYSLSASDLEMGLKIESD